MRLRIIRAIFFTYINKESSHFDRVNFVKTESKNIIKRPKNRSIGRNTTGAIVCRHRGGGNKILYRTIDFFQKKRL